MPPPPTKALDSGLLVTNHLNLLYMLSAGLVLPPAGFGDKYYQDTLGSFPGWIPLFVEKVSRRAIDYSTREAGHLKPVLVEVALGGLSGQVFAYGEYGEDGTRELRFPEQLHGTEQVIFVPAPLPTSWIKSIVYPSVDDKRFCEADAKDFGNVPIADFKGRANKTLFRQGDGHTLAAVRRSGRTRNPAADATRRRWRHGDVAAFRQPGRVGR